MVCRGDPESVLRERVRLTRLQKAGSDDPAFGV